MRLAGVAVLVVLLGVIWATGRGNGSGQTPTCLEVDRTEAENAIADGLVERVRVTTEQDRPERGALVVTLDMNEENACWQLPQGVANQDALLRVIGAVTVYNGVRAGEQRIDFEFERQPNIPSALLATATPTPTVTPVPTDTPTPTETPMPPTETPVPTPTAPPTATPAPTQPPPFPAVGSPAAAPPAPRVAPEAPALLPAPTVPPTAPAP